jgi:flagellar export protein FliJ
LSTFETDKIDISVSRSEEVSKAIVEAVLDASGAKVKRREDSWIVSGDSNTLPEPLATLIPESSTGQIRIQFEGEQEGSDSEGETTEGDSNQVPIYNLGPKSELFEELLHSMGDSLPLYSGSISVTGESWPMPAWVTASSLEVSEVSFSPYFERTGIWFLVDISIETVSEFERDLLVAVGVDPDSGKRLPLLETLGEQYTGSYADREDAEPRALDVTIESSLNTDPDTALSAVKSVTEEHLTPVIERIQRRAENEAGVEFEEYVEVQRDRINSLQEEISDLESDLEELRTTLEQVDSKAKRLETLEAQSQKRETLETKRREREKLVQSNRNGFPEYQKKVRERHAVNVRCTYVSAIEASYPKGDLFITLAGKDAQNTVRVAYGHHAAFFERPSCERCGTELTEKNPAAIFAGVICGERCCASE